jgi:hypothetical protein
MTTTNCVGKADIEDSCWLLPLGRAPLPSQRMALFAAGPRIGQVAQRSASAASNVDIDLVEVPQSRNRKIPFHERRSKCKIS